MLQRSDAFLTTKVNNELVMLNITTGDFIGLTQTASVIWDLLEHPATIETVCCSLQDKFSVEPGVCLAQVTSFVDDMVARGAIVDTRDG